ncbi:MAG: cell division transport system ATP-binding protein [Parvicella sp.]|jgi:cell division transport system ATP-binding protein
MSNETIIHYNGVDIYQNEQLVLMNVAFDVEPGEFVYLIGKTGSGKSSILKTLYGELKIKAGTANIIDYDLVKIKRRKILALRRKLGVIFQDFQLLDDRNIEENLRFVLKATGWKKKTEIQARIQEVLDLVGMSDKLKKMPHQVSGGEQQRISIARALLNDPSVIIADEPTGNLDPETTKDIMKLLFDISKNGKTVVMATHDYEMMLKFPSRTIRCEDQKVMEVNLMEAPEFAGRI